LALAIKTALKGAEGSQLSRKRLREELEPELSLCGDKETRKEAFATALETLQAKGKVTVEGSTVSFCARSQKRAKTEQEPEAKADGQAEVKEEKPVQKVESAASEAADEYRKENQIRSVGDKPAPLPDPYLAFEAALETFGKKVVAKLQADYEKPSPIQAQSWPIALAGKDMVAVAKTGSGKTLAFLLPSLTVASRQQQSGNKSAGPCVVVLAPTRELATQIEEVNKNYAGLLGITSACVYGGVPKPPQAKALKSLSNGIIVATPGRLVDHMHDGNVKLASAKVVVLDEADRMLDMGFEPQLKEIFGAMPAKGQRQLLLFTATWPKAIKKLAAAYLAEENHVHISIGANDDKGPSANTSVTQVFYQITDDEKDRKVLGEIFAMGDDARVIAFTNTKRRADNLAKLLWSNGYGCCAVHGDKPQAEREKALQAFRSGEWPVLVATDVASRGLDITGVTHVINFDMPRDVEGYVHRIGRTGRAGKTGASITFWNPDYDAECAPALAKIAVDAGQPVPPWLEKAAAKMGQGKKLWAVSKIAECKVD
jgi:superfamily II DNA/RNA helicase